ncbi:hypothetical protein HIM_04826 [Hirsutella minnesotensis 3608]|uniref:Uncharacterized protein n=1 Tax=Hirsutella minnesotensis 3608 TaxID=1043627 RepID=A0A0F8A5P1_9HYPO|nr:hypothetical protein HIM_04826 [Hirsutella minnesotensis 3608]
MDMDIEMGDAVDASHDMLGHDMPGADDILQPDEPDEPGEVADDDPQDATDESAALVPTKLHIRGLDTLHTDDIKAYVKAHFGAVDKIEWIDDTSANLAFGSEPTAREAIIALSSIDIADATALAPGESLPAKPLADRPEVSLNVRFALASDKKHAGAATRSRYYLLHPEHDPEERRRRQQESRSRYRDRDGDFRQDYRRRRQSRDRPSEPFEASMYDDAPRPEQTRRHSDPDDRSKSYAQENRGKELFADRPSRRDRSASPRREDGDSAQMDNLVNASRRNRTHARNIRDRLPVNNSAKELFPTKSSGRGGQLDQLERSIGSASLREEDMPKVVSTAVASASDGFNIRGLASQRSNATSGFTIKGTAANARELFPDKLGGTNAGKELLDTNRSVRRRKAQDLFS